jgi:hypothetical protein
VKLLVPVAGILFWALFFGGGQSTSRLAWIGGAAVALAALAGAAALAGWIPRPAVGRLGAGFVAAYAALVLWFGISIWWSVTPDRSWDYVNRGVAYLAFLVVGFFLATLGSRRAVANALALLFALTIAYALLAKVVPSLYADYGSTARLRAPLGHPNALALVGVFALVLGLWRRRIDGTLLVFGATLTILLAYSRGGVVVALVAALLWLWFDRRQDSFVALALGGAGGIAVAGIALALPGITKDQQPHSVRAHDGLVFLAVVLVAGAVVALLAWRASRLPESRTLVRALLAGIALACVAGVVVVAVHGSRTNTSPAGQHCTAGAGRLSCASSDARLDWWRQSLDMFTDEPLHGTGAASFELAHRINRAHFVRATSEPHNLALQLLGETGIVGFALFAAAVVLAVLAARRRFRDDAVTVALAVCALAYLLHTLIEIDYDFVAVSGPFFVLLGALLARPGTRLVRRESVWAAGAVLLGAAAILSLAAPVVAQHKVDRALANGDAHLAAQAHSWDPLSIAPLEAEALIEEVRGNTLRALRLYHETIDTQPDNPVGWIDLGLFELHTRHDACAAYRALNQAYTLDRFSYPEVAQKGGALDQARAKVNAGACG